MHRYARAFADGVQAVDDVIRIAILRHHDLTINVGRNTAHLIVNGWYHWNRLFGYIDVGKVNANLVNRRQALHDGLGADVG